MTFRLKIEGKFLLFPFFTVIYFREARAVLVK